MADSTQSIGAVLLRRTLKMAAVSFWTATFAFLLWVHAAEVLRGYRIRHYPSALGRITHSELVPTRFYSGEQHYDAAARYEYVVDGVKITGNRYRFTRDINLDEDEIKALRTKYAVGAVVSVRYNPANPYASALVAEISGADVLLVALFLPFNCASVCFWATIVGWCRRRWLKPEAGGVTIRRRGMGVDVRLPATSPAQAAGWILMIGSTVVLLNLIFWGLLNQSPATYAAGLIVGLATLSLAAVGAYLWRTYSGSSGREDLGIQSDTRRLVLPSTFGRAEPLEASFDEVLAVEVRTVTRAYGEQVAITSYVVLLHFERPVGLATEHKLAEWYDGDRACAFGTWLNAQIAGEQPGIVHTAA